MNPSREPVSGIRMKMQWGTFCKSVAREPQTNESTVIGVMPGMTVEIGLSAQAAAVNSQGPFNVSFPLWVFAVFHIENPPPEAQKETVETILSLGSHSLRSSMELDLVGGEDATTLNLRLQAEGGLPLVAGLQTLTMVFKHNGHEIGKVELPIRVKVSIREGAG